jgi:hypothetical protein
MTGRTETHPPAPPSASRFVAVWSVSPKPDCFFEAVAPLGEALARVLHLAQSRRAVDARKRYVRRSRDLRRRSGASHGDDGLSLRVSVSLVLQSVGDLAQPVAPVDYRRDLSGLDEFLQRNQVLPGVPHEEDAHRLAHER